MSFPRACFVAGTDTGAGKTLVTCALLHALQQRGRMVVGVKPVAAGAEDTEGRRANTDASALLAASNLPGLDMRQINPVLLQDPLSPHIAAQREGVTLRAAAIAGQVGKVLSGAAGHYLVEGAGGWLAPVSERETMADLAAALDLPVILVVGLRLGCLNHALLTAESIARTGLGLYGWVATCTDPQMSALEENVRTLGQRLTGRSLGYIPWQERPDPLKMADYLLLDG